jgi:hypothetical protein
MIHREWELERWLECLGISNSQRIKRLQDMLRHAAEDRMTAADHVICQKSLCRLQRQRMVTHDIEEITTGDTTDRP